jgi:hypothetical protein
LGVQLLEVETHKLEEQNMLSPMAMDYHCCSSSAGCNFFLPLLDRKDKVACWLASSDKNIIKRIVYSQSVFLHNISSESNFF